MMLSDLGELPAVKLTETDYLRFEIDTLSPFGHEVAAKELRETPERKQKAVEELKKLLQGTNEIPYHLTYITVFSIGKFTVKFHFND